MVYTFQQIALYLIITNAGPNPSTAATELHKVGSFRTMTDCVSSSKIAVFGSTDRNNTASPDYKFACIPEASKIRWSSADDDERGLTIRRKD